MCGAIASEEQGLKRFEVDDSALPVEQLGHD